MTAPRGIELPNWIDQAARSHPEKLALTFAARRWTFAEARVASDAAAAILTAARGDKPGRIGILSANRPGFAFAVHAATRMSVPIVPLNWRLTSEEIAWQLRDADVTLLVVDEQRQTTAASAAAGFPITILPIGDLELPPDVLGQPEAAPPVDVTREAAIMYTSGTSGRPKGARITYANLWFSAVSSALRLGHRHDDVWLAAMPMFHIGGLSILFRAAIGALPVILQERFDPNSFMAALASGATLTSVVPTMLQRLLEFAGDQPWPPSLRCVLIGGSAAPPKLVEQCLGHGIPVAPTYGLTETTSQVTTLRPDVAASRPSSSGLPLPLTEVRIMTADGPAVTDEIGSIEVRGPTLFAGYLADPDRVSELGSSDWFATGDVGFKDDDGYLYVVDRRADLIVTGGENVYPAEIERVLREHDSVADAGVVGIADTEWGFRPVAAVVWHGGHDTAIADLRQFCVERLAAFKVPDRFLLLSELPRSPSGKLLRLALRETIERELGDAEQSAN